MIAFVFVMQTWLTNQQMNTFTVIISEQLHVPLKQLHTVQQLPVT